MNYPENILFEECIPVTWKQQIDICILQKTERDLKKVIKRCKENNLEIYPEKSNIFYIFEKCNLSDIKVVILGQDPYHSNSNQANGMAFSVSNDITTPPSLRNIQKELISCYPESKKENDLSNWVTQGVFLLNTSLTVTQNKPGSHIKIWNDFIIEIIKLISDQENVIFCLWGKNAENMEKYIDSSKNIILKSSHPSPLSCYKTEQPFFGSNIFKKINDILLSKQKQEIFW